ncbi:MAG: glycosyltransferase [Candidatus Omnitrophota bacterium]|jgi:cellulose synthase/poly-beta-1,6-N-acetylglucosamine synthase-like glycosyltransferase
MKKNPVMFGTMIFCWLCAAFYFSPRVLALVVGPENIFAKIAVACFSILLNIFWFYAFYHLVIILFSYIKSTPGYNIVRQNQEKAPAVALLYTTCNDFKEEAVLTCLAQGYDNFRTFILDDSTNREYKERIDEFVARYSKAISVIRRPERIGYKAGNLNYGLSKIGNFEYFSVSDADTLLPSDYIIKLFPYFSDSRVAFVQSRQEFNSNQKSTFAQGLGYQIELHCDHYLSTKNKYGFVMFYGHGALMRLDVLRAIGGFPEVATEDLAYSMKIKEKGYYGVYAKDVTCMEDFPSTYRQYRKRNEKWIRGTAECLFKFYPDFLKSRNISWIEKFDIIVSAQSLLLGLPFLALLLSVGIILPFYFYHFQFQGPMFKMPLAFNDTFVGTLVGISGNLFWRWDFFSMLILTIVAPILPAILEMIHHPVKRFRYIAMYTFMFYATQVNSSIAALAYLVSKKADFPVTADNSVSLANSKIAVIIECVFAGLFLTIGLTSRNIWFLSFAAGTAIGVVILNSGFENRFVRFLAITPLIILAVILLFIGKTLQ